MIFNSFDITFLSKNWKIKVIGSKGNREIKSTTTNKLRITDSNTFTISGDLSQIVAINSNFNYVSFNIKNLPKLDNLKNYNMSGELYGDVANIGDMINFFSLNTSGSNYHGIFGDLSKIGNVENELRLINNASGIIYKWLKISNKPKLIAINSDHNIIFDKQYMFNSDFGGLYIQAQTVSSNTIDDILNSLAASVLTRNPMGNEISLISNNKRTANSDDAVAYLVGLGFRIMN